MREKLAAIKARIPKKVIMPIVSLLLVVLAAFIFITIFKSCTKSEYSNTIDLDILEPDGTINPKKFFEDSIREDIENRMRYRRKNEF